jgi:hypothetical protein
MARDFRSRPERAQGGKAALGSCLWPIDRIAARTMMQCMIENDRRTPVRHGTRYGYEITAGDLISGRRLRAVPKSANRAATSAAIAASSSAAAHAGAESGDAEG